jgi:Tol biopolymer transport system component
MLPISKARLFRNRRLVLAALAAIPATLAFGSGAAARTDAHGGVHMNIYVAPVRGGHPTRLTKNPEVGPERLAYDPFWSPDGRRMLFTEVLCHYCSSDIHLMPARPAAGRVWLNHTIGKGFHPRWSPNGRQIAFVGSAGGIYVMRPDGSKRRLIAKGGFTDDGPSWSPDSRRIVFTEQQTSTRWRLFVVGADGKGLHALRSGAQPAVNPAWSPTGRRIAFAEQQKSGRWQIVTMALDGSRRRRISQGQSSDSFPVWSPDGRQLAFVRQEGNSSAVFTERPDGRDVHRVSPRFMKAVEPAWSPGGKRIAFSADLT